MRKEYSTNQKFKSSAKLNTLLQGSIDFVNVEAGEEPNPSSVGRPEVCFNESSDRSKRIKRDQIIEDIWRIQTYPRLR